MIIIETNIEKIKKWKLPVTIVMYSSLFLTLAFLGQLCAGILVSSYIIVSS
jgi:hypothetical protein